ncbi:CocE/NonD family hydrolase [Nocardia sp. NPDC004722]
MTPDQETAVLAVVNDLLTGNAAGVPSALTDDISSVRAQSAVRVVKIPGHGGVELDAFVARPLLGGPHPLIVLPAGLAKIGWRMYGGAIIRLLMRRYAVVAYTERGLPGSGGELTVAGHEDVEDGIKVIDWALADENLQADADRIGMAGISYGSGISQLVALRDPRVRAVAALSTWADLGAALYDNGTRHLAAADALGTISDKPSAELTKIIDDFKQDTNIEGVLDYARPRSPAYQLEHLQGPPAPTFFTSFWHETIFPQNQLLEYFDRYPGPKRLDLAIGDHGAVEIPGILLGVYTRTSEAAYAWLDRFVRDIDNGIDSDGAVRTETMHGFTMTAYDSLESWAEPPQRHYLGAPATGSADGTLSTDQPAAQSQSFGTGAAQVQAVTELVNDGFKERLLMPIRQSFADIDRTKAAVWVSPEALQAPLRIAGQPQLEVTVTSSAATATLITYLFDLDPFNNTLRIITHAAATVKNASAPTPLQVRLQATDYEVPVDHQLVVVMDTSDNLYTVPETPPGGVVTLSAEHGSGLLDIPIKS